MPGVGAEDETPAGASRGDPRLERSADDDVGGGIDLAWVDAFVIKDRRRGEVERQDQLDAFATA